MSSRVREDLISTLHEARYHLDRLLERVSDPAVSAATVVDLLHSLGHLDARRDALVRALREEASEARKREEERSVRQFVLRALEEIGAPQNAAFLQEYVWARERVDLDTRGFGALRRDERRSWGRRPGHRLAYIVPALNVEGRPLARWMARSDWPLAQRIVIPGAERLLDLHKLLALLEAHDHSDPNSPDPWVRLIEEYATELLPEAMLSADLSAAKDVGWLEGIRQAAESEIRELKRPLEKESEVAASHLAGLPEEKQLWGRTPSDAQAF